MNDLCIALADALRKLAEKWPEKFRIVEYPRGELFHNLANFSEFNLANLDYSPSFTLDHMDAVAAALGYWLDMNHSLTMDGHDLYCSHWGKLGHGAKGAVDFKPDKRSASLAALLAIITHALEDGK